MITQSYSLNMVPGGPLTRIHASQYEARGEAIDTGRRIVLALYNGAEPFVIPQGSVVTVDGLKPDHKGVSYTIHYTTATNEAYLHLNQQLTAAAGDVRCRLTIRHDGAVLGSAIFILAVEKAPISEETDMSQTDIAALETLAQIAADSAQSARDSANSAALSASAAPTMARGCYGGDINAISSQGDDSLYPNSVVWVGPSQGTTNMPLDGHGYCITWSSDTGFIQEIYYTNGAHCRRLRCNEGSGSAWKSWEWVSPPMVVGTEYRTTQRWMNAPVYTKIIGCGTASNGKEVDYGLTGQTLVKATGIIGSFICPRIHSSLDNDNSCWMEFWNQKLFIHCGSNVAGNYIGYAQLWYTRG